MERESIETTLELWASSLRNEGTDASLFTQERVAASAGLFLDGLHSAFSYSSAANSSMASSRL
jgi:hypothetical protein